MSRLDSGLDGFHLLVYIIGAVLALGTIVTICFLVILSHIDRRKERREVATLAETVRASLAAFGEYCATRFGTEGIPSDLDELQKVYKTGVGEAQGLLFVLGATKLRQAVRLFDLWDRPEETEGEGVLLEEAKLLIKEARGHMDM